MEIPTLDCALFFYGGYGVGIEWDKYTVYYYQWRAPTVTGYNSDIMDVKGAVNYRKTGNNWQGAILEFSNSPSILYGESQWQVGKYYIEFTLKDPDSCSWIIKDPDSSVVIDETNGKVIREWSIVKEIKLLPKPYLETDLFVYDGTEKTPNVVKVITRGLN